MNFVSCVKWIRKGVAKSNPEKVQLTQEELQKIICATRDEIKVMEKGENCGVDDDDDKEEPMDAEEIAAAASTSDNFNFDDYDKEDEAADSLFGVSNLIVNTEEDDYKLKDEDYDSEEEDDVIKATDNLIAVGHVEGDASVLEIFLYNDQDGDLYVHHDILLPTVPLCLEWLSYEPTDSKPGNLVAVGGMSAVIGVWDLDVVDCLEPAYQLGKFSVKKKRNKSHGHKDAVLDIAWNKNYKHILASGSVDKTIILWDLDIGRAATTFTDFTDKVQCLKWHPSDYHSLIAGSSDRTVKVFDCRMNEVRNEWHIKGEIEKVNFSPWDDNKIYIGTNKGKIISYDIRQPNEELWNVKAHEKEITGLEFDVNCHGLLTTCSMDEMIKIWDVTDNSPNLKSSKNFGLEGVQCVDLNPDCPFVACIGGTKRKKNFKVVNLQHEMLQPVNNCTDTTPVVFSGQSSLNPENQSMQLTEEAFSSLSIKSKKFKSKKRFGHRNKRS